MNQIDYKKLVPEAVRALQKLEPTIDSHNIDESLIELIKLRASQINGCAYCVDMHTEQAKELGVHYRRIAAVAAWQESPFFDEREKAALHLTEALTRLSEEAPSDDVYQTASDQFDDESLAVLVMVINAITCWNRLWVSFRTPEIPKLNVE